MPRDVEKRNEAVRPLRVRRLILAVIAGVAILALGFAGGVVATWDSTPSLLAPPNPDGSVAVTQQAFDDSQIVSLKLAPGPARALQAPTSGRITRFDCAVGQTFQSGTSTLAVDGVPAVMLATGHPMWRDLQKGDSGNDVTDLVAELQRLGYLSDSATTVTPNVLSAWRALSKAVGVPAETSSTTIMLANIVWLPSDGIAATACGIAVGDTVSVGQRLADLTPTLVGASLAVQPTTTATGQYTVKVDNEVFNLSAGAITDPGDLNRLVGLPTIMAALAAGTNQTTVWYALSEPIQVSVLPPAAVVTGPTGSCVVGDGTAMSVRVVSSKLGQTFVTFNDAVPQRVSTSPPQGLKCG